MRAKTLQAILDGYPADELFQIDEATLAEHALGILRLQSASTGLFLRDRSAASVSALVFVPRERYTTELRIRLGPNWSRRWPASP